MVHTLVTLGNGKLEKYTIFVYTNLLDKIFSLWKVHVRYTNWNDVISKAGSKKNVNIIAFLISFLIKIKINNSKQKKKIMTEYFLEEEDDVYTEEEMAEE